MGPISSRRPFLFLVCIGNPFGCSIFRRGSPTTAALSPARAAGSASKAVPFLFFYCFQIFGMWCLHHLARSWCSNWIFVVFVCILCSFYSVAQQATYTVQACAGLSGRIKAAPFHSFYQQLEVGQDYFQRRCFKLDVVIRLAGCLQFQLLFFNASLLVR